MTVPSLFRRGRRSGLAGPGSSAEWAITPIGGMPASPSMACATAAKIVSQLLDAGLAEADVRKLVSTNPARMLGIDD